LTILYISLAWFVGIVAAAILLAQPIIILVFGIPFTYEMRRKGILTSTAPVSRYTVSLFLLLGLFGLVTWAMWHFFPAFIWGYIVGVVLTLLPGLRKCGRNQANISDFFEVNDEYVDRRAFIAWINRTEAPGETVIIDKPDGKEPLADSLGSQILLIAAHDVAQFMKTWTLQLNDRDQVLVAAEYSAFLISYVDRLALGKLGEPDRSALMNDVINKVKSGFCTQRQLGDSEDARADFFEELVTKRLIDYGPYKNMGAHIFAAARTLVERFCNNIPESEMPERALETGKVISISVTAALGSLPCFKALI